MLTPKTPLPWRVEIEDDDEFVFSSKGDDVVIDGISGFIDKQDRDYAVYAANLLPKIIDELEYLAGNEDEASMAYQTIAGILKLVETYRP